MEINSGFKGLTELSLFQLVRIIAALFYVYV